MISPRNFHLCGASGTKTLLLYLRFWLKSRLQLMFPVALKSRKNDSARVTRHSDWIRCAVCRFVYFSHHLQRVWSDACNEIHHEASGINGIRCTSAMCIEVQSPICSWQMVLCFECTFLMHVCSYLCSPRININGKHVQHFHWIITNKLALVIIFLWHL